MRDTTAAEDAVQETLLAALAGESNFAGRSNIRTWLTGILKHKIVDTIRRQSREQPDGALGQKQFLAALEACLRALPERTARVFMMRGHLGLETSEICKELGITATHCWVMLHRARMSLRLCLEMNWFALRAHLAICDGCRNVKAQLRFLRLALKRLSQDDNEEKSA